MSAIALSILYGALLGALGQAVRAVDGVNKLIQAEQLARFSWFRLAWTLVTGAVVGAMLSLGNEVTWATSLTYALAGYVGTDLIEKRAAKL